MSSRDPRGRRAESPLGARLDRRPRRRLRRRRALRRGGLGAGRARRAPATTRWPRRSSTSPASRSETARATSTTASGRRPPASTRSTRRSSGCGESSAWSPRAGAARASPSRSRTTSTRPGSGRGPASRAPPRARSRTWSSGRVRSGLRELRGLAGAPLHKASGTDPVLELRPDPRRRAALRRLVDVLPPGRARARARRAGRRAVRAAAPAARRDAARRPAPRSASTAATRPRTTPRGSPPRRRASSSSPARSRGQRYHFLRLDPHRNLAQLEAAGFAYDSTLGFSDALGFRAGHRAPVPPLGLRARRRRATSSRCRSRRWTSRSRPSATSA